MTGWQKARTYMTAGKLFNPPETCWWEKRKDHGGENIIKGSRQSNVREPGLSLCKLHGESPSFALPGSPREAQPDSAPRSPNLPSSPGGSLAGLTSFAARSPPSEVKGTSGAGHPVLAMATRKRVTLRLPTGTFWPVTETEIFTLQGKILQAQPSGAQALV